jgi:UDP-N-acetylmuramoyl-tripeptide--D-alanyl-D-alanine ligase
MKLESISQLYSIFKQYPIACTDSRACVPHSLFFALKGESFNANAFALSALEQGCRYAVIDEAEYKLDERFILVENVLQTLQDLATFHRRQLATPMLAITGSNGKTTTKELIAAVLSQKYKIHFTQGNYNNHIGVPLTLLQLKPEHEIAIVEMGANAQGEIGQLCKIARPNFGLITNVGKAHLEGFGGVEGVKKGKGEMYHYIARSGKLIFINKNNQPLVEMAQKAGLENKMLGYIHGEQIADAGSPFLEVKIGGSCGGFAVKTNLVGAYNVENVQAATTIGRYFSMSNEQIKRGLESYEPTNNRSQLTETAHNKLIVDAYNANPSSMSVAIKNFAQIEAENKLPILGDMFELGEDSQKEHQAMVDLLVENKFDRAFLVGKEFSKTKNPFQNFENTAELLQYIEKEHIKNNYILIKASRGIRLEDVVGKL